MCIYINNIHKNVLNKKLICVYKHYKDVCCNYRCLAKAKIPMQRGENAKVDSGLTAERLL